MPRTSISKGQVIAIAGCIALAAVIAALPKSVPFEVENRAGVGNDTEERVDVRIAKGISAVLQGESPMQGIMVLRQVLEEYPESIKANLALAVFSVVSGQDEKALDRFQRVAGAAQQDKSAAKFLAQVYAREGKTEMIIEPMMAYKARVQDRAVQELVNEIINELNNI